MSRDSYTQDNPKEIGSKYSNLDRYSKSVLKDLHEKQGNRVRNFYNPAEVNLNEINSRDTRRYHHNTHTNSHRGLNTKNRYNKILQVRERYREDRIRLNREKVHDIQSYNDYLNQCELDSREVLQATNLDQLIDEENELSSENDLPQQKQEFSLEEIMDMLNISDT